MDIRYRITGGIPLKGDVTISGSKNAALPLIAASVLTEGETVLTNVPFLRDIKVLLKILDFLGAETSFVDGTVRIRTHNLQSKPIPAEYVSKLRAAIVLLGPLLARFGVVEMSYPGGCVLGKRSVEAHIEALTQLGAEDMSTDEVLHLQGTMKAGVVILPEFSVTASENAIMAASLVEGETRIEMVAAEPHVQAVELMVQAMGAEVKGIGSHTVIIHGRKTLQCTEYKVPPDYIEAGCFAIAALVTRGKVRIHDFEYDHLISFLDVLRRMGGEWKYDAQEKVLLVDGELSSLKASSIKTNIFPGFPTDLMSPMGVVMTQATGVSRVFETLFEGRMAFLFELEKMGAHIEMLNAHQALFIGPSPLRSATVTSNDLRAGAAMVLAALCAEGDTTIMDVRYIERGYDHLDEKLRSLGAKVEKIEIPDAEEVAQKVTQGNVDAAAKTEAKTSH
jgi:UDP-N-acetylglucosamine 1-carboxyvinyltransferase